jgi:hypothetical protein
VVVIRTLLGFTHICNCTFILILLWCWSPSCMSSSFILEKIWRNPSINMRWI